MKHSKSFFGYKSKEKRKNERIGYAISILLRNEENKLCPIKSVNWFKSQSHTRTHARTHARTHIHTHIYTYTYIQTRKVFAQNRRMFVPKVLNICLNIFCFKNLFSLLQNFLFEEAISSSTLIFCLKTSLLQNAVGNFQ